MVSGGVILGIVIMAGLALVIGLGMARQERSLVSDGQPISSSSFITPRRHISAGTTSITPRAFTAIQRRHVNVVVHMPPKVIEARATLIKPAPRTVWEEKGWTLSADNGGEVYDGYFQVTDQRAGQQRRFRGRIVMEDDVPEAYIAHPPAQLKEHPKGPCFRRCEGDWFHMHWNIAADHPDEAILYVENVLCEAINA